MLDVDGQVIAADALVQRVQELLVVIDAGDPLAAPADSGAPTDFLVPLHGMNVVQGQMHPPDLSGASGARGRLGALVKRVIRRLTSWYVEPRWIQQQEFNRQTVGFSVIVAGHLRRIDSELADLRDQLFRQRLQAITANERVRGALREVDDIEATLAEQKKLLELVAMQEDVRSLSREVAIVLDRLGAVGVSGAEIDYAGFEDLFRGESADVAKAQERYLTLFPPAAEPGRVIDIGCGRGEMLELLEKEGHDVLGVDTDAAMVDLCVKRGLPAVVDDGIHFLSQTDDDSLKGIFCAQVVEHLITPQLEQLVRLAHRTLRRGGVFVVETINPRSSFALGNHFYADTSHVRPVHPETLRYICEQLGFHSVQLEERSPHPSLALAGSLPDDAVGEALSLLLSNVFGYQDYVIVATK